MIKVIRASILAAPLVLVGDGLRTTPAHAAEQVTPASDTQFIEMLQGCWWRPTSVGSSTACFATGGRVAFLAYNSSVRDALGTDGRYSVAGGKVRIEGTGDAWPFERSVISCDAVVEPLKTLVLAQCDGEGDVTRRLVGEPRDYPVSDSRWQFTGSFADCDWCEMGTLD